MDVWAQVAALWMNKNAQLVAVLKDEDRMFQVAYLADILIKMNDVNLSLKGTTVNLFYTNAKLCSFEMKLLYWLEYVGKGDMDCFSIRKCS